MDGSKVLFEARAQNIQQIHKRVEHLVGAVRFGVEDVVSAPLKIKKVIRFLCCHGNWTDRRIDNSLVDKESLSRGGHVVAFVLHGYDVQVHKVALHFAFAWRWVPTAECQLLQAGWLLRKRKY